MKSLPTTTLSTICLLVATKSAPAQSAPANNVDESPDGLANLARNSAQLGSLRGQKNGMAPQTRIFNGQDVNDANRWMPPRFGDQRSPCPFLNTMANHGFINRNGTNIDINDMADKLEEVFNVKASFLHEGPINQMIECGQTYTDENRVERFDMDVLFDDRCEEHEASFVRADSYFGFQASKHVDDTLLNNLMRRNPGESILTFDNILDYQAERITNSRLTNPETEFRLFDVDNMGAQAMFLFLVSTDETMMTIEKERLYSFLLNEELPDGFLSASLRDTPFDPSDPSDFTHERIMQTKKNVDDMFNKRLWQ